MLIYLLSLLDNESDRIILSDMVGRYEQLTLKVANSILHDTHDTEDAVISAWIKVVEHFDIAKKNMAKSWSVFESWLVLVVKNAAKDERRKRTRNPTPVEMWPMPSTENVELESEVRMVVELIKSLPEQHRQALEMRILGEYSFKEIGKSLGCSADTAKRRFNRAREVLKERMEIDVE